MYITVASPKSEEDPYEERKKLEDAGFSTAWRRHRCYASWPIKDIDEVPIFWRKDVFNSSNDIPDILAVTFNNVKCGSVCNRVLTKTMDRAIMINPHNPTTTGIYPFQLTVDIVNQTIAVKINRHRINEPTPANFINLLRICEKHFHNPGSNVCFNRSKLIKETQEEIGQGKPTEQTRKRWGRIVEIEQTLVEGTQTNFVF
jgi:hypothetical protein